MARQLRWHEKFRRRKKKRRKRGRAKILSPPNPLPFCPPEQKSFLETKVRIFVKKSSPRTNLLRKFNGVKILTKRHRQFSEFGFWVPLSGIASPRQRRDETENSSCINWRKGRDSNSRYLAVYGLSRTAS